MFKELMILKSIRYQVQSTCLILLTGLLAAKSLRTPDLEYPILNTHLYLGKFVYLFHYSGEQSSHTLIYQTLHVVYRLLI